MLLWESLNRHWGLFSKAKLFPKNKIFGTVWVVFVLFFERRAKIPKNMLVSFLFYKPEGLQKTKFLLVLNLKNLSQKEDFIPNFSNLGLNGSNEIFETDALWFKIARENSRLP